MCDKNIKISDDAAIRNKSIMTLSDQQMAVVASEVFLRKTVVGIDIFLKKNNGFLIFKYYPL